METTDLTIYDWVIYKEKLCVVWGINGITNTLTLEIGKGDDMGLFLFDISTSDVKPVPLTEEILASNGARKEGIYDFNIGDCMLKKLSDHWEVFFNEHPNLIKKIKYVHQLKHCLLFLNKENTFINFNA